MRRPLAIALLLAGLFAPLLIPLLARPQPASAAQSYPILFVTQVPVRADFTTIGSTFGNHRGALDSAPRGGGLWVRYPDGALKDLTAAAGYGSPDAFQGPESIAVRDPSVSWDGTKAIFSMVIGAPSQQYQVQTYYWQLYEITGLAKGQTPTITKVPNQPAGFNNVSPIYGTDGRIIFTSDRPRDGSRHLYPQLDEYELAPTNSGLWSLSPATGDLRLLNHAPSGDFTPSIDSFGRVIFTQWDHLQRDQEADADAMGTGTYGTFDYASEAADAAVLPTRTEVFPEPRAERTDLLAGTNLAGHSFNQFFPWQIREDGSEGEVLNHIGRHELHGYIPASLTDDPNVEEYYGQRARTNQSRIENMFQIRESPTVPGRYYGVDAPEFATHGSGQVIAIDAPPTANPDQISVAYITHRSTSSTTAEGAAADPNHSGHYRDPLPLSDGSLIAAHAAETRAEGNSGASRYAFRLAYLTKGASGFYAAGAALTPGISADLSWWDPDSLVSYKGPLWEMSPVELRPRAIPAAAQPALAPPELGAFQAAGVSEAALRAYMRQRNLALVVSHDVTTRDDFDRQQPFNLRVPGGAQTLGAPAGKVYDVGYLQFFQGQQLRGWTGGGSSIRAGRRVLARPMGNPFSDNPAAGGPAGSVAIAADGSMAAFVPAGRATSWQLTAPSGAPVVRERYWLTFQPGEIRVCASCHGVNQLDQAGGLAPVNTPQALIDLLARWADQQAINANLTEHSYTPVVRR